MEIETHKVQTGTLMKNKFSHMLMSHWLRTRYACAPPPLFRRQRISVPIATMLLLLNISSAQDLIVNGTVNNTGTIRVKNQTVIAQPTFGGEIELKGANQTLPAKQYQSVRLTGTGTKTTSGGDLSVQKNLTIAAAVTLQIPKGNIITLGDTLFESGKLKGAIQKSVNLSGSTTSSNFGNIGATIQWSSNAPGITNVIRASDSVQIGNGNQSIKRYYQIQPTDATATGTVVFKFSNNELNGHDINHLQLWRSGDNGATWQRQVPVVDTLLKTISKTNVTLAGRWAIADTVRALGPLHGAAGIPANIVQASVQTATPIILTTLDTLKVLITDIFGTPVNNISVKFAINSRPTPAAGGTLTDTTVVTNTSGIASTVFTLGSKVGEYEVIATAVNLDTVRIKTNARHGTAQTLASVAIAQQIKPILTPLDTAFTITVSDIGGNPVDSAHVQFAIVDLPLGSFGESISVASVLTDLSGKASTILTVGSKAAQYKVRAKVVGLLDSVIFTANAIHGTAKSIAKTALTVQSKPILSQLDSAFTIVVSDTGGNPVENAQVQFAIVDLPIGSFGQSLSVTNVLSDPLGRASTKLTLGSKAAMYRVKATVNGIIDSAIFNATAVPGSPSSIAQLGGNNQSGVNGQPLINPFDVFISDAGGNPVPGDTVNFTIQNGQTFGAALSKTKVPTDNLGQASTILTLGTKTGSYVVQAQSSSISGALVFNANALAGSAAVTNIVFGNNQTLPISRVLTDSFVVRVNDQNGNPVPNVPVKFTIASAPAGGIGILSVVDATTDSTGNASTRLTLGDKVGTYAVNAVVNGVPIVSFNATATQGTAAAYAAFSGNNQSTQIITTLPNDLVVHVVDAGGNNVAGATVNFAIDTIPANATGQLIANPSVVSDANGIARTTLTLGNKVGLYRVKASGVGVSDILFTATATHGAASAMVASAGLNQTKPILTDLDVPFAVHVTDVGGNDVSTSTVRFTITKSPNGDTSASINNNTPITDSLGVASTRLKLGTKVGTYEVTAFIITASQFESRPLGNKKLKTESSVNKNIEITFTATAIHGTAAVLAQISGNAQLRPTATTLDTAFVVTVKDIGGNIVPNAPVSFTITSHPANAIGQRLTDTLVTADSLGIASTLLTLGDLEGAYVVSAVVQGIVPAQFTSNAFYIYGDPNNDLDVNIADITSLVDHIHYKNIFSTADSIKSDLNKDGRVDTTDVSALRENILSRPLVFTGMTAMIGSVNRSGIKPNVTPTPVKQQYFSNATTQLEVTSQGLRLNMTNSVPIRGIELRIRTKDSTAVDKINYLFSRAQNMDVVVRSVDNEITVLVYSLLNSEIQPGEGTILRLPKITSLDQIDTSQVILAITSNIAVRPEVKTAAAPASEYPVTYRLEQNYPNPFNGSTIIRYDIPDVKEKETKTAIQVFNILGQKVKTLISAPHDPGPHQVMWDGTNDNNERVATGVYFYRLITKNFLTTKKMIYVK
jgi:hypothetical protein